MTTMQGTEPWLLWGNTQVLTARSSGGSQASLAAQSQLCKVSYKRPDTWHWFFAAKLLDGPALPLVGQNAQLTVSFDLTIGVGRSNLTIPAFEQYQFRWSGIAPFPVGQMKYSTAVFGPNRIDQPGVGETRDNFIDQVTSQDIQIGCRVLHTSTITGSVCTVEVDAHFAPKHHLRPEWFGNATGVGPKGATLGNSIPRFNAGEDKGT